MNNKEISFFLMISSLIPVLLIGMSIRHYLDTLDYVKVMISLSIVIFLILMARTFSRIAFVKKRTNKPLYTNGDIV